MTLRTALLAALALVAFAANSLIARAALATTSIDAGSFTALRIASGAFALWLLLAWRTRRLTTPRSGSWRAALALFAYAVAFSYAYLGLDTGVGALLLFGAVQASMLLGGRLRGERFSGWQRLGLAISMAGLLWLTWPGLSAPPLHAAALMLAAGLAWGLYSLAARGSGDPLAATAGNFLRAVLPAVALFGAVLALAEPRWPAAGVAYAVLSGGLMSGPAYVLWYAALRGLAAGQAAALQLLVPVLAALGGALVLGEVLSLRLLIAAALILGGIALTLRHRPGA